MVMNESRSAGERLMSDPEMAALDSIGPLELTLGPRQAMCLMAQLQLALRHPENTSESAELARTIAHHLQDHLSVNDTLREFCENGWGV